MPPYPNDIPVVIVGAGPTGLTAANLLAVYGVDCVVLEQTAEPMNLPRAIVIDDEGARTMQVFGLDKTYLKDTMEGVGSRYYDDEGNCFAETGRGPRNFGFAKRQFFFQPELEAALRDVSAQTSPGTLHFGAEVTDVRTILTRPSIPSSFAVARGQRSACLLRMVGDVTNSCFSPAKPANRCCRTDFSRI